MRKIKSSISHSRSKNNRLVEKSMSHTMKGWSIMAFNKISKIAKGNTYYTSSIDMAMFGHVEDMFGAVIALDDEHLRVFPTRNDMLKWSKDSRFNLRCSYNAALTKLIKHTKMNLTETRFINIKIVKMDMIVETTFATVFIWNNKVYEVDLFSDQSFDGRYISITTGTTKAVPNLLSSSSTGSRNKMKK